MESIKEIIYGLPPPPARIRKKQLQVICVGPPRSATMSLAVALRELGLETYHDQNLVAEANPAYTHQWDLLTRKKLYGAPSGTHISVTEFDAIIGHIEAFVGIGAYTFAVEIMEAYPDAKVILNTRKDLDAWHRSIMKAVSNVLESRVLRTLRFFNTDLFWSWELLFTHMLQGLSRSPSVKAGILYNGKSAYQEHCDMIRSVTPQDRLLEWSVEDGWEPLCKVCQIYWFYIHQSSFRLNLIEHSSSINLYRAGRFLAPMTGPLSVVI